MIAKAITEPTSLHSLRNKNDQLQKRNEALRKRFQREKMSNDLATLTSKSKTKALLKKHGFQPS